MFEGFQERWVRGDGAEIFVRSGGPTDAPPLLLLHGYPQTSAMWHKVAPGLARDFRVICADLRGYGRSSKPESMSDHSPYSKRAMGNDMVAVMAGLGHSRFFVGSHDRGARVAHRMGLDHPDRIAALSVLDIAPTREMYANTDMKFARRYWHWFFLIQPAPGPEEMIGADPERYFRRKVLNLTAGTDVFASEALDEYLLAWRDPEVIHASCEDYRAAATIDLAHDEADEGRKLSMPLQAIWAAGGTIEACFDTLSLWRQRADHVEGRALGQTHYLPEEVPGDILKEFRSFFRQHIGRL